MTAQRDNAAFSHSVSFYNSWLIAAIGPAFALPRYDLRDRISAATAEKSEAAVGQTVRFPRFAAARLIEQLGLTSLQPTFVEGPIGLFGTRIKAYY